MIKIAPLAFTLFAAVASSPSLAQEKSDTTPVPELVRQLDDDAFAVREAAARKLQDAGAEAIPDLVKAATDGGAEASRRALSILQNICSDADEPCVAALDTIAGSGSPEEKELAESLLKLTRASKSGEIPLDELVIPGATVETEGDTMRIRLAGGGTIQTKVAGGRGTSRSVIKNGGNTLIMGSSDGKRAFIFSSPEAGIKMKVTADEDGEPVTRAYQFKNADQLRDLNPDLFEFFSALQKGTPRAPRIPRP